MISSRNQLTGTIKSISRGVVTAEVIIITDSGLEICSIITLGSCLQMNLEPGSVVTAIIKASDVLVAVGNSLTISSRNNIPGTIKKINTGPVSDEIIIDADGTELVSIITETSVKRMNLTESMSVSALIKASNVMIIK